MMRSWWLLLLLVPVAGAIEDAQGDQEVGIRVLTQDGEDTVQWLPENPLGWYPEADILEASVHESQNDIIFQVRTGGSNVNDPTRPQDFFYLFYDFTFDLRGVETIGRFQRFLWEDSGDFDAFLIGTPDETSFTGMQTTGYWPAERVDGDTLRVEFPKERFVDADYVPLREGDRLGDIQLRVHNDGFSFSKVPTFACPVIDNNQVPPARPSSCDVKVREETDGLGDLPIELQPEGVGHLLMRSDKPWRFSNGLATTFLFEVDLHNFDDTSDEVVLSATDVPKGWEVLHPAKIELGPEEITTVPVAVTVPFVHEHGAVEFAVLEGISEKDPTSEVGINLGVIFPSPPQPGGHHPRLYFHAFQDSFFGRTWMNTDPTVAREESTRAAGRYEGGRIPVGTGSVSGLPTEATWSWTAFLQPSLQLGLDFDLNREVAAELALEVGSGITATPSGTLSLATREGLVPLAELTGEETTIAPGETKKVRLTGSPLPEADRIDGGTGNLYLQIQLEGTPSPEESARMVTGTQASLVTDESFLDLPLIDFHEEVDLGDLELNAYTLAGNRTLAEVNPDKAAVFIFNVTNLLSQKETIDWTLSGSQSDWGRVLPQQTRIEGAGVGQVVVEVRPPASALDGDVAELLLMGTDSKDRQVFARMTAYVVTGEEIPDESALAEAAAADVAKQNEALKKDSPGFEMIALVALLAALALLLRKRR